MVTKSLTIRKVALIKLSFRIHHSLVGLRRLCPLGASKSTLEITLKFLEGILNKLDDSGLKVESSNPVAGVEDTDKAWRMDSQNYF